MVELVWLIPALPLAGFAILLVAGPRLGEPRAGWLATAASAGSFLLTLITFGGLLGLESAEDGGAGGHGGRWFVSTLFEWMPIGGLEVDAALLVDPLSMTMALFVTGVGTLIHLYSVGYMGGDPKYSKFFLYLNLFLFSMLMLVLGENMVVTFLGWEGVGTCSYLLISFWHERPTAATAGKKAFVTNRIGDFGFMVATFLLWTALGTVSYTGIAALSGGLATGTATAVSLLLLLAAAGKSAQLPLYVWLPDAMEGPTPVSAMVHAATMVTAGVYLLVRLNPVLTDTALLIIAIVGAATALFAALAAVAQHDIKKVLAYSTISQLGYMMLALGVFGYAVAIFHLFTHAFFKALLFLGSGSVNHATNTFDMRRMGGLRTVMPITFWTFLIGTLSLAGVFPLAGFWSKDEILLEAWVNNKGLYTVAAIASFVTALYMFRAIFLTFFGEYKGGEPVDHEDEDSHFHGDPAHPHESSWVMTVPLLILTAGAIAAGWWAWGKEFHHFVEAAVPAEALHKAPDFSYWIAITSSLIAVAGIGTAWAIYHRGLVSSTEIRRIAFPLAALLERKFFLDDLYERAFAVQAFQRGWNRLVEQFDTFGVDGTVNGVGWVGQQSSRVLRHAQTGQVQLYGAGIAAGVFIVAIIVFIANPL